MSASTDAPHVRPAHDADGPRLVELIRGCFEEYPGCVLDLDGEMPELRAIASAAARDDGRFWVAELGDRVVGCVGAFPVEDGASLELKKLYVDAGVRRAGLGRLLCGLVVDEARRRGAARIVLWSDTRFLDAHRLYRRLGFERGEAVRALHDLSDSYERFFSMPLDGRARADALS